jgi:hypothetical protein
MQLYCTIHLLFFSDFGLAYVIQFVFMDFVQCRMASVYFNAEVLSTLFIQQG